MLEIVNGKTDALILHPQRLIELEQQDRDERSLPVVAVNDLRPLTGLEHELQRRLAEECKPRNIVGRAIQVPTPEEVFIRMRLDEEALAAVDPAKPHRAMDRAVKPGHPQIVVGDRHSVDPVMAQTVVLGQDDLHRVASQLKLSTEPEYDVTDAPGMRDRRALSGHHHDEHEPNPTARHTQPSSRFSASGAASALS